MNVLIAVLGLGLLVLVHEAGHFFTARAVGMSPRRFYIGFPPALVRVRRKGIEYGIGAIPLGGYVKIPGMHRPAPADLDAHFAAALAETPQLIGPVEHVKRRLAEDDLVGAGKLIPELEQAIEHEQLSPRALKVARRGLSELKDGLAGDAYWRQRAWKRVAVIFAGPGTNLLFAIALFVALFNLVGGTATRTVDAVEQDTPAASADLQPGDQIVAVNHVRVRAEDISSRIRSSKGSVTLSVFRDGSPRPIDLPAVKPRNVDGVRRLGFRLKAEPLGPAGSLWQSVRLTGIVTKEIGASLLQLTHAKGREQVSSPVGIVDQSSKVLSEGVETYLWVLGLLSLSLALLNLLPLLPLDGGHIAFSIVEGIRGKAVGREVYERVSAIGIALVLLLFFVGLSNDIGRLGGN